VTSTIVTSIKTGKSPNWTWYPLAIRQCQQLYMVSASLTVLNILTSPPSFRVWLANHFGSTRKLPLLSFLIIIVIKNAIPEYSIAINYYKLTQKATGRKIIAIYMRYFLV